MKKYYIVGNRAFETWIQATEYCEENDLDGETMILEVTDGKKMSDGKKTNNSNIDYIKPGIDLKTIYKIEYITNKHDFERVCEGKHPAPWELYQIKETEELQTAMTIFLAHYSSERTYDVKLFEEILLNGEIVREQCITDIIGFSNICDNNNQHLSEILRSRDETINMQAKIVEEMEIIKRAFGRDQYDKFIKDQRAKTA